MFSVVVPVYNHREYLSSTMLSALQSPLVTQVLVVDDGSSDRSGRLAQAFVGGKLTLLANAPPGNLGAPARLNALVKGARNDWVAVLNSDDEFVPGRFEAIEGDARRRRADLFFGDLVIIDSRSDRVGLRRAVTDNEFPWKNLEKAIDASDHGRWSELLVQQNIVATTTNMVFHKELFERIGGFREFRYCHDWDFALRAALAGVIKYAPLMMSRYRLHSRNTIRESRRRVVAEVRAMMVGIEADYAVLKVGPLHEALQHNRYLHPPRSTWLGVIRAADSMSGLAEAKLSTLGRGLQFADSGSQLTREADYLYSPLNGLAALTPNDLRNIRLAAAVRGYDLFLVSRSLEPFPQVGAESARDLIIYRRGWSAAGVQPTTARLMRLLPASHAPLPLKEMIGQGRFSVDHAFADTPLEDRSWPEPVPLQHDSLGARPALPVVFIFPIFLAMGGAERLMIETTRHLASKYHFVIVNTEPLRPELGSLHGDALQSAEVYDLAETVRQEDRLVAIELLKEHYAPALVWITNGSPWQIAHARQLREIFRDTPIVDNQAYDHEQGWINSFAEADVRSADRYIAVNERIRMAMVERFGIGPESIDVVYHGAKIAHLRSDLSVGNDREQRRAALGLPVTGLVFGMIGRLTPQKRPQDLVQLSAAVLASGSSHHFLWAGPGELRAEIDALRQELKAENFSLLEARADVRPLYEVMDGLIVTSEFEGLPLVVLEALAMGVPVLSTPVGAIPDVLARFGSGRIGGVPGDLAALHAAFNEFVENLPSLRTNAMARRLEFIDAFCSERMAADYDASWMRAREEHRTRNGHDRLSRPDPGATPF